MARPCMLRAEQEQDAVMEVEASQSNNRAPTSKEARAGRGPEAGKAMEKLAVATTKALIGLAGRSRALEGAVFKTFLTPADHRLGKAAALAGKKVPRGSSCLREEAQPLSAGF